MVDGLSHLALTGKPPMQLGNVVHSQMCSESLSKDQGGSVEILWTVWSAKWEN